MYSSVRPTETATALSLTAELMDLISSRSILALTMGLTSITETPSLSSSFTSSSFSRKLILPPSDFPVQRMVMSEILILLIN